MTLGAKIVMLVKLPSRITSLAPSTITSPISIPASLYTLTVPSTLATILILISEFPLMIMEFSPPPLTTSLPSILILFRVRLPSPTPSPTIKSPVIVRSFNSTPGTLTIIFPSTTSVTTSASEIYCFITLSITFANSALVIFALGLILPFDP